MKRVLRATLIVLLLGAVEMTKVYAYDFTSVAPNGQTLYFTITNSALRYVKVVYPGNSSSNPWNGFEKPTGNLVLPSSVTHNLFSYSVTAIGNYAFYGCTELTEVTICESITSIGGYAFWQCPSLATVHFNAENCTQMYTDYSGYHSVFNSGTTATGPTAITMLTIGSDVTKIPNYAFSNSPSLNQQLELPNTLTYIGKDAFYNCSSLYGTLTIPNAVTSIGDGAFNGCSGFTGTLTFSFGGSWAPSPRGTTALTSSALTSIGNGAFRDCYGLTGHIELPNSVTTLGDHAFYGCTGITEVTIGTGITIVYGYAFWNCPMLATIHFNAINCTQMYTDYSGYHSVFNSGTTATGPTAITTLTIGNDVTKIPNYAFSNSPGLNQQLTLPNYVTYIGKDAFYNCSSLYGTLTIPNPVTSIGDGAFNGCSGISGTLTLSNQLVTIGNSAFRDCSGLTGHVIVPNSVTTLGDHSFYGCTGITEVTIGTGVTKVYGYSFWNCPLLTTVHFNAANCTQMYTDYSGYHSVFSSGATAPGSPAITILTIGSGVNRIPNYAFANSSHVFGVVLPQYLTDIGKEAFKGCVHLASLTVLAMTPPSVGNNAFNSVPTSIPVFVPCNKAGTYAAANGWSQFSNIIELCSNQITAVAYPSEGGSVNGAGIYATGQNCALSAIPNAGYTFLHWTKNGEVVSTNTTYVFVVNESGNYVASFTETSTETFTITVSANPSNGGTVTGGGSYEQGSNCTVTATANSGYTFTNWTENGNVVSTNADYNFTVSSNRSLVANFDSNPVNCIINASASPAYGGSVSGAGTYALGQTCTLYASPNSDYMFLNWTEGISWEAGGVVVSTSTDYSFTVTGNRNLVANFVSASVDHHWTFDPYQFSDNMNVLGVVTLDGELIESELIEVGAFCGNECRGSNFMTIEGTQYLVLMTLFGENGDVITFRAYDHQVGQEIEATCVSTLVFEANGVVGMPPDDLYVFDFQTNVDVTQTTTFNSGWTWWSPFIETEDANILGQLKEGLGANGLVIKSQLQATMHLGSNWVGTLTMNNEDGYMVKANAVVEVDITGQAAMAENHPITLNSGWTWIGYPSTETMSVTEALANLTPQVNDVIKGQNASAMYMAGQWRGSLTLTPGIGLMYKSNSNSQKTLIYANPSKMTETEAKSIETYWNANHSAYPTNMTVLAVVELEGEELTNGDYELAAFVGNECRGSVRLMDVEPLNRHFALLTVSGEEAAELRFALYDTEAGEEYHNSDETLAYETDAVFGSPDEPFVIRFRSNTGVDEWANSVQVFPNPVEHGQSVSLSLSAEEMGEIQVEIINALGMVEMRRTASLQTITAPNVAGVYTLRITIEGKGTCYRKLIVR